MIKNASCMARLRDIGFISKTVFSHAMPFDLLYATAYGIGGSCINVFAPLTIVAQGISVPISRGGPPIFNG